MNHNEILLLFTFQMQSPAKLLASRQFISVLVSPIVDLGKFRI